MSGGSMNYLYSKLEYDATFSTNTPERKAFRQHLHKVANALHDIEWVDSGDKGPGDENDAIRACLQPDAVMFALVEQAKDVMAALRVEIERAEPLYTAPPRCPNCASLEAQNSELDLKLSELEQQRDALLEACKRVKETRVFLGAIAQEMLDAAIAAVEGENT